MLTIVVVTVTPLINKSGKKSQPPSPITPKQEVFKPTDTISFVFDLGKVPGLSLNSKKQIISSAHALSQNSYIENNLTITPKIVSKVTQKEILIPLDVQKESEQKYLITGEGNQHNLTPGSYEIQVEVDTNGNTQTFTQDFNWGVLAINTNKSIYAPDETSIISIAVLDEKGEMVCDATVNLEMKNPAGEVTTLTTTNGEIIVNKNCHKKEYIEEPDYETEYKVGNSGEYLMELTAITPNGTYSISDSFEVRDYVPLDVERKTATRIYPPVSYPVTIIIKANENFSGAIEEKIPSDFKIVSSESGTIEREIEENPPEFGFVQKAQYFPTINTAKITEKDFYKVLSWDVELKKGEEYKLQYTYKAPDISPEFYLLGPLTFIDSETKKVVFSEIRQWQIAADAIAYVNSNSSAGTGSTRGTSLTASANNLVVFICGVESNLIITGPGGAWIEAYNESGTVSQGAWYKISAGATESPSCTFSASDSGTAIILEYSGTEIATGHILDTKNTATGSGDTTVECPSVTPSSGNHLYVSSFFFDPGDTASISSWTNSFTQRQQARYTSGPKGGRVIAGAADKISTGAQSTVATIDVTGPWRCHTLAFNDDGDWADGTVYTNDDEVTPITSQSVCGVINNGTPICTTTDGNGDFSIEFDGTAGVAGDQLTFYMDGGVNFGNTVTIFDSNDLLTTDNLRVYEDHVVLRHEQGTDISIVDMDAYDNDQNATDMLYDAEDLATDTLSVENPNELFVQSGFTFAPTGNITTIHDIEIEGTWTAATGETVSLDGSYNLDAGGTLTPSTSTVTFNNGMSENVFTLGTGGFYNLTLSGGGALYVQDPLVVYNNLSITSGILDVVSTENNQINIGNNFDNDDEFFHRAGTVVFDHTGATTITIDSDSNVGGFYNVIFNDGGGGATYQLTTEMDVDNNLTITGGTLDSNGNDMYIGGNWTNNDTFIEGTITVTFDGATNATIDSGCADEATCTNENFYSVVIEKNVLSTTVDLANTHLRVLTLVELNVGTVNQNAQNVQLEGGMDINVNGKWSGLSTGNFTLGSILLNEGNITLNANGVACGGADDILIRSTASVQRLWNGSGTFNIMDVDVQYQAGNAEINVQSGTDSGNNGANWTIHDACYALLFEGLKMEDLLIN